MRTSPSVRIPPPPQVRDDAWWRGRGRQASLGTLLAAHFTGPQTVCCPLPAARCPLLVLGHPGIGKSLLTRVLMARLPASDFLPVRVELRSVDADASVLEQITQSVAVQLDGEGTWSDVLAGAAGRLPVVLLDGLDELMQVSLPEWSADGSRSQTNPRSCDSSRPTSLASCPCTTPSGYGFSTFWNIASSRTSVDARVP